MTIIKETDSIQPLLHTLQEIAEQTQTTHPAVHKRVISEIKKYRAGHSAETNAAFMLGKEYRDSKYSVLLSDLRLDMDGDIAQIDHVAFNCFGIVNLFETKSFSSGLTIDADGTCWNGVDRHRREIPSPLRQSQRHESTLRKALAQCGYDAIEFRHFVLVDYKAKLEKPAKGFENYCRPDRISEAREQVALGVGSTFRALGRMATGKSLNKEELCKVGEQLAALHQPLQPNLWGKLGLTAPAPEVTTPAETPLLTSSRLAQKRGMTTQAFLLQAAKAGLVYEKDDTFFATLDGEQLGAQNRSGRHGAYILWPENLQLP